MAYKVEKTEEGRQYYIETRSTFRRFIGSILCAMGSHRDWFSIKGHGTITYRYCVRCGKHKTDRF